MRLLIQDLRRSKPFRVGLSYAVIGVSLLVVSNLFLIAFGAPPWALRLIAAMVAIPFPFVVVLTWALTAGPLEGQRARPRPWDAGAR